MVGRKQVLENRVDHLYEVFAPYTAAGFHYCDCGCTEEAEIKHLLFTPLRELGGEALFRFNLSALYTQGDLEHYKHFLPRIFEVYSCLVDDDNLTAWELLTKLDYAEWRKWPAEEVKAIQQFWLANWSYAANDSSVSSASEEWDAYDTLIGLPTLLDEWKVTTSPVAMAGFVHFFYYNGNAVLTNTFRVNKRPVSEPFINWIKRERIAEAVEKQYFELAGSDPVAAAEVSAVHGILDSAGLG